MEPDRGAFIFFADDRDDGRRLDRVIASHLGQCSRTQAAGLIREGLIRLGNQVVKPAQRVHAGEQIRGRVPPPKPTEIIPEPVALDILYQDDHIIVINKPAGLVVHPAPGHDTGTLVHGLLYRFPDIFSVGGELRPGIVHRLDRDTSGCLVVALNDRAHQGISRQFKERSVYKEYLALVRGRMVANRGSVDEPIGRHPADRKKMTINGLKARTALTHWQVQVQYSAATLIELHLKTGRTHQIRVHLSHLGHSVVGDTIYGPRRSADTLNISTTVRMPIHRQMLHARCLGFTHPVTGAKVVFKAPIPEDMADVVAALNYHLESMADK